MVTKGYILRKYGNSKLKDLISVELERLRSENIKVSLHYKLLREKFTAQGYKPFEIFLFYNYHKFKRQGKSEIDALFSAYKLAAWRASHK